MKSIWILVKWSKLNLIFQKLILFFFSSPECPILWIRIDPDLRIIRELQFEQADYNWQCELRYERDILSQFEALEALKRYPSQTTRETLGNVLDLSTCFYRVRIECAYILTHV